MPPSEAELLAKLVAQTAKAIDRPVTPISAPIDTQAIAEEEERRLALLRNPPRRY
jgi:hypothetical protein